jgi:hypothetical protein
MYVLCTYSSMARFFFLYECIKFVFVPHFTLRSVIHFRIQNKGQYNVYTVNEKFSNVHIQRFSNNVHTHTHTHILIYVYTYVVVFEMFHCFCSLFIIKL